MSKIQISCTDQSLKLITTPTLASGGVEETKIEFDFCERWNGFTKTAVFYQDPNTAYYSLVDGNDTCVIPWEATVNDGVLFIGVFGVKGAVTRTSEVIRYRVVEGAMTEDITPSAPNTDVYIQLLAAYNSVSAPMDELMRTVRQHEKRISNLETGSVFETDSSVAYTKTVPANACTYAEVEAVGGMSLYGDGQVLKNGIVTAVESKDKQGAAIENVAIPQAVRDLEGYGLGLTATVRNYVDFENKKFVRMCKTVTYNGSESWTINTALSGVTRFSINCPAGAIDVGDSYSTHTVACNYYPSDLTLTQANAQFSTSQALHFRTAFWFYTNCGATTIWKSFLEAKPLVVVYQLATPEEVDISDLLDEDFYLKVEGGGTVTMVNDEELAVPSTINYQLKGV